MYLLSSKTPCQTWPAALDIFDVRSLKLENKYFFSILLIILLFNFFFWAPVNFKFSFALCFWCKYKSFFAAFHEFSVIPSEFVATMAGYYDRCREGGWILSQEAIFSNHDDDYDVLSPLIRGGSKAGIFNCTQRHGDTEVFLYLLNLPWPLHLCLLNHPWPNTACLTTSGLKILSA